MHRLFFYYELLSLQKLQTLNYIIHFKNETSVNLDSFETLRIKDVIRDHKQTKYFSLIVLKMPYFQINFKRIL